MPDRSSRRPLGLLGVWLLGTIGVAFVMLGSLRPGEQVVLHALVAIGALGACVLPDGRLENAGVVARVGLAGAILAGATALGLLPVPRQLAAVLAPGRLAALPDAAWLSLGTDTRAIGGELATLSLVVGFGALVATYGAARFRRGEVEVAVTGATGLFAASALSHAATDATAMLGVFAPETVRTPFFAPLVNRDHAASVLLLGGPVALGVALDPTRDRGVRGGAGAVAVAALAGVIWIGSAGAILAAAAVGILAALRARARLPPGVLAGFVGLAFVAQLWAAQTAWGEGALGARAGLWRDALRLFGDHWLAGAGGGTFADAIRPYRTDRLFVVMDHAHNEPLEWLAEGGLVGVVAMGLAAAGLRPGPLRDGRGAPLAYGLLALGLHACVDFPLQVPAIAMAAAAVGACLLAVFGARRAIAPRSVRAVLVAVFLAQVPAAGWQARTHVIDATARRALTAPLDGEFDPKWGLPFGLLRAEPESTRWSARDTEHSTGGLTAVVPIALEIRDRFPDDPDALRDAARVLARAERHDEATAVLLRVVERDPADYRAWVGLARIARAQGDRKLAAERWAEAFRRHAPAHLKEAFATFPLGLWWLEALADADARCSLELSQELAAAGDAETALLAWEQAARLDPAAFADHLDRAVLLVRVGRAAEALPWIEGVVARNPDDPRVLGQYGRVLTALGRHDEATAAYLRGARGQPALGVLALRSAEAAGGPRGGLELARKLALTGDPHPEMALEIARLQLAAGDPRDCVSDIERARLTQGALAAPAGELLAKCRAAAGARQ